MAPKKKDTSLLTEEQKAVSQSINDQFLSFLNNTMEVDVETEEMPELIKTGIPTLDVVLGGGIIVGGFIQLYGRAGTGKSSFACKILSSFQSVTNNKSIAMYIDSESAMTLARLKQLGCYDKATGKVNVKLINEKIVEKIFGIIKNVIEFKKNNSDIANIPSIIVWDSIPTAIAEKEDTIEDPKQVVGYRANLLKTYIYQIKKELKKYKITLVAINQTRDNIQMGMTPKDLQIKGMKSTEHIPGGKAIEFATDQLLQMHDKTDILEEKTGFDGKEVSFKAIKNKAFTPYIETNTAFSYVGGYSTFWSTFFALVNAKYITVGGAFYRMTKYETGFRAKEALKLYSSNPEFKEAMKYEIHRYCEDMIQKYKDQMERVNDDPMVEDQSGVAVNVMVDSKYHKLNEPDCEETCETKTVEDADFD